MVNLPFTGSLWCNVDIALRRIETLYKQETEAIGLMVIEWYILRALYEQDGQMASQLARAVGRAPTSFTPILDKIENKGLIERRIHPSDRRGVKIHLTPQGKALEKSVITSVERIENKLRERLSDKEWQSYERVTANLQELDQ